jgi:ribosomal protein L4
MNRSAFRKALFTVLTDKLNDGKLIILDKFDATRKTSELAKKFSGLVTKAGLGKKFALVIPAHNKDLENAASNLPHSKVMVATQLNILDLMRYDMIIMQDAIPVIEKTYLK